jgi:hypothetical protein
MRISKILMPNRLWRPILFLAVGYFMTGTYLQAQCMNTVGYNAVWGPCSNSTPQGSFAVVDASRFSGQGLDLCGQILASFEQYYNIPTGTHAKNYGIVIDARGVNPSLGCSVNPWNLPQQGNVTYEEPPSSVVLLPSGIIPLSTTLQMPAFARLVGEGPGVTILQANNLPNCTSSCDMIDMGYSNLSSNPGFYNCSVNGTAQIVDCPGIAIEHLGLDGNSGNSQANVNGIVNNSAQELSYVEDVAFSNIKGTAFSLLGIVTGNLHGTSNNSGPYSNLTMSNVGACAIINGTVGTRGIHGLNCNTPSLSGAAIDVEGSNNSLEDISLSGANGTNTDGIVLGLTSAAQNNVLFNIRGNGFTNLIHISPVFGNDSSQSNCPAVDTVHTSVYNVCDITIMGVTNGTSGSGITTIYDQVSGATLNDSTLGMYVLGEPVQSGSTSTNDTFLGNSHFTTSLDFPTWLVGSTQAMGLACPSAGSLYSVTSGAAPTLLECESSGSNMTWQMVK